MLNIYTFSMEVAENLYKPLFYKRLLFSIALFFSPFIISTFIDFPFLTLYACIIAVAMILFILSFIWLKSKRNIYKNSKIILNEDVIEYYFETFFAVAYTGAASRTYVCKIKNIRSVSFNNEYIIIEGDINKIALRPNSEADKALSIIKIPKVYNKTNEFVDFVISKIEK